MFFAVSMCHWLSLASYCVDTYIKWFYYATHMHSAVYVVVHCLFVCLFATADLLVYISTVYLLFYCYKQTRRMAIANRTCVSFCNHSISLRHILASLGTPLGQSW